MAVFFALGLVLGSLAQVIVREHVERRTQAAIAEYEREAAAEPEAPVVGGVPETMERTDSAAAA